MKLIRKMVVSEMIGEFLKAELHSSRFRSGSLKALAELDYDENIIENPDYNSDSENTKRERILGLCRGWPSENLFINFPRNVKWFYASINISELKQVYRLKRHQYMSDDERLLSRTAEQVKLHHKVPNINNNLIQSICNKIKSHDVIPPLIMVSIDMEDKKVLIEGHSRSVAYCVCDFQDDVPVIIGISPDIHKWAYY